MKTESKIQQEIIMWMRNKYCTRNAVPRCAIFSVPNERKDKKELMRMKATGLMSGVSDLIVVVPDKVIFVECKDAKGRQSDKQKEFENIVSVLGFEYWLVRDLEDFQKKVQKVLLINNN